MAISDFPQPYPVQLSGSPFCVWLLRRMGWRMEFAGLPSLQGVIVVYPHTSNWDFVILLFVKWAIGIQVNFWGKAGLFRVPLFGPWLRWLGGIPIDRSAAHGVVGQAVDALKLAREQGRYSWLALAPEGTRKRSEGWRSGFYRTAVQSGVPLAMVRLDYRLREVQLVDFIALCGVPAQDFARIAQVYQGITALKPGNAAPIALLDAIAPRRTAPRDY